jgi:hypothetical protein
LANGRCLIWDFTCPDTLTASHLNRAVLAPGAIANDAEQRQTTKYFSPAAHYHFVLVFIETLGSLGDEALQFFRDVGRQVAAETGERR